MSHECVLKSSYRRNSAGFTLIEVLVSTIIFTIVVAGLASIFIAGKRLLLHQRSRMAGGELGRYFLDPLQMNVKQSDWDNSTGNYKDTNWFHSHPDETVGNYTANYMVENLPSDTGPMRKVKVTVSWSESAP